MTAGARDNWMTVAAIAILAACASTVAHEAIGHGSACLAGGGHVTQLTSVYFHCSRGNPWIDGAGPAGNLVAGVLAALALGGVSPAAAKARLLLTLVMAFSLFWEAGYLLASFVLGHGDWIGALAWVGPPDAARPVAFVLGLCLYGLATPLVARAMAPFGSRAPALARTAWVAAALATSLAALLYAPDRTGAAGQAALEIGAASWPLLMMRTRGGEAPSPIGFSPAWFIAGVVVVAVFAATLGRGLSAT